MPHYIIPELFLISYAYNLWLLKGLDLPYDVSQCIAKPWNLRNSHLCNWWLSSISLTTLASSHHSWVWKFKVQSGAHTSGSVWTVLVFFDWAPGTWEFPGQEWNLCHSRDLSCCSDNTGSLTHCMTRELPKCSIFNFINLSLNFLSWKLLKRQKIRKNSIANSPQIFFVCVQFCLYCLKVSCKHHDTLSLNTSACIS